jgi:hypothetical protein
MNRLEGQILLSFLVLGLACGRGSGPEPGADSNGASAHVSTPLDDSIQAVVQAYEAGAVSLDRATQQLADLVEPTGGFAHAAGVSPRAEALFQTTGRELRRRVAVRHGVPDSQP